MELDYAYFAEKADRLADRRICTWGAEFDSVQGDRFPFFFALSLVTRFVVRPEDQLEGHAFHIEVSHPTNPEKVRACDPSPIKANRNPIEPGLPSGASVVIGFGILFDEPGKYIVRVFLDGKEVKSLPLYVSGPEADSPPEKST
jgi:hypothetical protein